MKPLAVAVLTMTLAMPRDGAGTPITCDDAQSYRQLSDINVQTGRLAPGESACFSLPLARNEMVRIAISPERGYLRARILSPRKEELQRTWTSSFAFAAPSPMLTLEAPVTGAYIVELSVPTWVGFTDSQSFRIHVESRESAAVRAARQTQLQRYPRVAWLRSNATSLRTLNPNDADFTDLEFLRDVLRDTKLVFLGEGDNGGDSAKANMAEWAFSPRQTVSSSYGTTANAYALDRTPAGSSGGTASGVAASFGVGGLGSDTGTSIRGPSAHLSLVGIRSAAASPPLLYSCPKAKRGVSVPTWPQCSRPGSVIENS